MRRAAASNARAVLGKSFSGSSIEQARSLKESFLANTFLLKFEAIREPSEQKRTENMKKNRHVLTENKAKKDGKDYF